MDIFWNCKFGQSEKWHSDWLCEQSEFCYNLWTAKMNCSCWSDFTQLKDIAILCRTWGRFFVLCKSLFVVFNFIGEHCSRISSLQIISFSSISTFFFALLLRIQYFGLVLLKTTCQPKPARKSTEQKIEDHVHKSDTLEQTENHLKIRHKMIMLSVLGVLPTV